MEITIVQLDSVWEDASANFARVEKLLMATRPRPGSLVILPEMFATGFSLDLTKTCAGRARDTEQFLKVLSGKHQVGVMGGLVRPGNDGLGRNEALILSPSGEVLARYLKQRPFSGGGEDLTHERGYEGVTFKWGGLRVAPFICYDLRFPELFRGAAKAGAEVFIVIAAWPKIRIDHWVTLLRARAIENQAYVVGVNRTGDEPNRPCGGRSVVIDPHGAIVADAGENEGVVAATLDPKVVRSWREEFPAYQDFLRWS